MGALLIKNAKLRDFQKLQDVLIKDGKFVRIAENIQGEGVATVDAAGNLTLPPFVDPHVHMDAVLSCGDLSRPNRSGTLLEAIDIWGERKPLLTKEILKKNAREVVKWYIANGVLRVRTHADCSDPTLLTVESLIEVRDEVRDLIDIQVVAFPQNGIFTSTEGEGLLRRALEMGADCVGGAPHIEYTREDGVRDVECVYQYAEKFDRMIDIHVDETGDTHSRFVEVMAKENIMRGWQGRAAASHTTAMHNYNNDYAFKLLGVLKKADMNMITNPFDNSVLQNRTDGYPRKRGHTRVDELLEKGVNVCIGHDSIMDPWYSMGKGNMLAAANLLAHTAHMNGHDQLLELMDMITHRSARTLGIEDKYGIKEGNPADLVILDAKDEAEALRLTSECLYVLRKGKVICRTTPALRTIDTSEIKENVDFKL
ncbi:MAG: cytosine deaminase [Oscillospiraceae bacterium]|nr:cytosine deaminase [Oscillospiraceae bacterium]